MVLVSGPGGEFFSLPYFFQFYVEQLMDVLFSCTFTSLSLGYFDFLPSWLVLKVITVLVPSGLAITLVELKIHLRHLPMSRVILWTL